MSITIENGRLGNQIIRNIAVSLIAEKFNLHVEYASQDIITNSLGIRLFVGENKYGSTAMLTDGNYRTIITRSVFWKNIDANKYYFQTRYIMALIHGYLHCDLVKERIMSMNTKWGERYGKNNDLFIHIRLTDVARLNPGVLYYLAAIRRIGDNGNNIDNIYISTDDAEHPIVRAIMGKYPKCKLVGEVLGCEDDGGGKNDGKNDGKNSEISSIQFGSTCRYIILSHGSFSAIIGHLAFNSTVMYPEYIEGKIWYGDMFRGHGWTEILQREWVNAGSEVKMKNGVAKSDAINNNSLFAFAKRPISRYRMQLRY
jgi:hypothetical protein